MDCEPRRVFNPKRRDNAERISRYNHYLTLTDLDDRVVTPVCRPDKHFLPLPAKLRIDNLVKVPFSYFPDLWKRRHGQNSMATARKAPNGNLATRRDSSLG